MQEYIPLDVLAMELALSRAYLRRLTDEGRLPFLDVNGRRRYDLQAVREALARMAAEQVATDPLQRALEDVARQGVQLEPVGPTKPPITG